MLIGSDISHHNHPFQINFGDFQIHKATEGASFLDNKFVAWVNDRKRYAENKINGAYHFVAPHSEPMEQAKFFAKWLKITEFDGIIAIDLEGKAMEKVIYDKDFSKKLLAAMNWLQEEFNKDLYFYTNTDGTNRLPMYYAEFKLWIASYNKTEPNISYRWKEHHKLIHDYDSAL